MRFSIVAAAVWLSLLPLAVAVAATPADAPATTAPATTAPAAAKPAAPAASSSGDAAAKHAKRTACLKDAKTKKLVGAEKTAFLKNCIGAP